MKQLTLDEKMTQELLTQLAEIPAKWSMNIIGAIQKTWSEQNPEEVEETTETA